MTVEPHGGKNINVQPMRRSKSIAMDGYVHAADIDFVVSDATSRMINLHKIHFSTTAISHLELHCTRCHKC